VGTAARFVDEFAEVPIDASGAVWFATANDAARIPEPILNRMHVYEIEPPDAEGAARIALAIYREIRAAHDWGRRFPESPCTTVVERLAALSPREMRRAVQSAFGNAKVAGRAELRPEDVQDGRAARRRIGF
jgi:ATP-dependent Lon protease